MDIVSTILDYLGASTHDVSGGKSLRRHIELSQFNSKHDEHVVVAESRGAKATSRGFMIRKGKYKLILPIKKESYSLDMMYCLEGKVDFNQSQVTLWF